MKRLIVNTYSRGLDTNNGRGVGTQSGRGTTTYNRSNQVSRAALLIVIFALAACAAPASTQGTAGQGGSNGNIPQIVIYFGGSQNGSTTATAAPAAAPSAASTATAEQHATNDTKADANLGTDAIKAVTPTLGGVTLPKTAPAPVEEKKNP